MLCVVTSLNFTFQLLSPNSHIFEISNSSTSDLKLHLSHSRMQLFKISLSINRYLKYSKRLFIKLWIEKDFYDLPWFIWFHSLFWLKGQSYIELQPIIQIKFKFFNPSLLNEFTNVKHVLNLYISKLIEQIWSIFFWMRYFRLQVY